jgi:hypothetical protein
MASVRALAAGRAKSLTAGEGSIILDAASHGGSGFTDKVALFGIGASPITRVLILGERGVLRYFAEPSRRRIW